jgi:uncharacterized coiled-coil protein SlyX
MIGIVVPAQGAPAPRAVLDARTAASWSRISDLEAEVAAQAAEITRLRQALEAAPDARKKTKRKQR